MVRPDYNSAIKFSQMADKDGEIVGSLGTVYLTGGGFYRRPFNGIGVNSQFGWQDMVWKVTPKRGGNFAFTNINDIDIGLVARCEIVIPYNNIQDYMDLRKIIARERHFKARFFDVDEGMWVEREMYCSESSKNQLFILGQSLIGVRDITVKLVGTNRDVEQPELTITYNLNGGSGAIPSKTLKVGDELTVANPSDFNVVGPNNRPFDHWETRTSDNDTMGEYHSGQETTIWNSMILYAVWA